MQRREIIYGMAGALAASKSAGAPSQGSDAMQPTPPARTTTLFNQSGASKHISVQCVLFCDGRLICLHKNALTEEPTVTCTTPDGSKLWAYELPKGSYLSLGTDQQRIIVHALYCASDHGNTPDCLVELDPATGRTGILGTVGSTNASGILHFAGDSRLFRLQSTGTEVWVIENRRPRKLERRNPMAVSFSGFQPHVELFAPDTMALVPVDGRSIFYSAVASGSVSEYPLVSPELTKGRAAYEARDRSRPPAPTGKTVKYSTGLVIPAVGSDRSGTLYAVVSPFEKGVAPIVAIDQGGHVSASRSAQLPLRSTGGFGAPRKLIVLPSELAIVLADGTVLWYPA